MSNNHNTYHFDFNDGLLFLYRNWKRLAIVTLIAAAVAAVVSGPWFIKPKYKSAALFYPGTVNSISSALFYSIKETAQDPLAFAEQEVTEQYLQLLSSSDLKARVMAKFNLMEHYGLDPANKASYKRLNELYDKNIKCSRTDYNSVKIEVLDESFEDAAKIANGIMFIVDEMRHEVQKRVADQILDIVQTEYHSKLRHVDSIEARLAELGKEGVFDVANQSKGISELTGKGSNNQFTEKEKEKLGQYGGEVTLLNNMLELEAENLTLLKTKYEQAKIDANGKLSNIFVINYASPSDDKAYPKRTIVVIVSALSAFVLACFLIVAIDRLKRFRQLIDQQSL